MPAGAAARVRSAGNRRPRSGSKRQEGAPAAVHRQSLEHRILLTATLCLLAFGAVMVYSASSPSGVMSGSGLGAGEFVRYLIFGGIGLVSFAVVCWQLLGHLPTWLVLVAATAAWAATSLLLYALQRLVLRRRRHDRA